MRFSKFSRTEENAKFLLNLKFDREDFNVKMLTEPILRIPSYACHIVNILGIVHEYTLLWQNALPKRHNPTLTLLSRKRCCPSPKVVRPFET